MRKTGLILGITAIIITTLFLIFSRTPVEKVATQTQTVVEAKPQTEEKTSGYFYPLSDYSSRIKERAHGEYFKASDKVNAACGKPFQGFHAGDDLETTKAEKEVEVPVVAVASGKIIQAGFVSGYGGLVVQAANLKDEPVTLYYGHLDLKSVNLKAGDGVKAGETIGNLGDECSSETDDARKHLHFAIKKGTDVDVRGYVPTEEILSNWLNPSRKLHAVHASEPM